MNWTHQKSGMLSKAFVYFFALLMLILDVACPWGVSFLKEHTQILDSPLEGTLLIVSVYLCSIPAWITLWSLRRILHRIQKGEVFTEANTKDMRRTSWCCMMVAAICLVSAIFFPTLSVIAAASAFMGLIVRIVRDAFRQAVSMKDELDFTV